MKKSSSAAVFLLQIVLLPVVVSVDISQEPPPPRDDVQQQSDADAAPPPAPERFPLHRNADDFGAKYEREKVESRRRATASSTTTTFAGRSQSSLISHFFLSKADVAQLWKTLTTSVHWEDLVLLAVIAWGSVPTVQKMPLIRLPRIKPPAPVGEQQGRDKERIEEEEEAKETTTGHHHWVVLLIADHVQQMAKIALAVYLVDAFKLTCIALGFEWVRRGNAPHAFAQSAYAVWIANRLAKLKKHLSRQYVNRHPDTFGRIKIVNRLADALIYAGTALIVLNILQVQMGVASAGFLALGSVGSLTIGLATQGIIKEILTGLMLASSDRIYEGDEVHFGNGVSGKVVKLGWMETVLRGSDEITVSIPNTDLVNQQVSNHSRVRYSQVKQVIRLQGTPENVEKIPDVLVAIKEEIRKSCPKLIDDGTRPFRAHWTDYGPHYLEITVDTRFRISPVKPEYWENREQVLLAIHRALKRYDCKLGTQSPALIVST
jgi:small-conductance mechanosensitive channel